MTFFPYILWLIWITRKEHCQFGQNDIFKLHTIWATAQKNKNCLLILIAPPRPLFWKVFVCKLPAICCLVVLLGYSYSVPTWRAFFPHLSPRPVSSLRAVRGGIRWIGANISRCSLLLNIFMNEFQLLQFLGQLLHRFSWRHGLADTFANKAAKQINKEFGISSRARVHTSWNWVFTLRPVCGEHVLLLHDSLQ